MPEEIIFGDPSGFGIRYVRGYISKDHPDWIYGYLHLILNGHVIGSADEFCSTETWLWSLKLILKRMLGDSDEFKHPDFFGRKDEEIFELIWKANQFESEFKKDFLHLPKLENSVWSSCHISLDETTDAYLITLTEHEDKLKFIWQGWRQPCPEEEIGKLFSCTATKQHFIDTCFECITFVESDYKNYPLS